jgi:hypothetical protein
MLLGASLAKDNKFEPPLFEDGAIPGSDPPGTEDDAEV